MCVLLDEVESLTRARSAAVSGSEPADAIRAVNALLTQVRLSAVCPEAEEPATCIANWGEAVERTRPMQYLRECLLCSWMLSRHTLTCWC